jgi:hypothetical protein
MTCPGTRSVGIGVEHVAAAESRRPVRWIVGVVWFCAAMAPTAALGQRPLGGDRLIQPRTAALALPEPGPGDYGASEVHLDGSVRSDMPAHPNDPGLTPAQTGPLPDDDARPLSPGFFRLPEERFRGPGQPLIQESWRLRPLSFGGFYGFVQGSQLIDDWAYEEQGMIGGMTLGWDFHHYFGCEMRLAFGRVVIGDNSRAIEAQIAADDAAGLGAADPARRRFDNGRDNDIFLWEVSVLYYPWGDSRWRPYATLGVGMTSVDFIDRLSTVYQDAFFTLPFGLGVKYLHSDCLAFRLELMDHMAFGGGKPIETLHHLSITAGMEVRFGGARRAYWPWNPGRHYW